MGRSHHPADAELRQREALEDALQVVPFGALEGLGHLLRVIRVGRVLWERVAGVQAPVVGVDELRWRCESVPMVRQGYSRSLRVS